MKFQYALLGLILMATIYAFSVKQKAYKPEPDFTAKEAVIYTTADSTNLRLTRTGNKTFQEAKQPLETEVAIFVNPNITFQSFIGIGGAATDAAAEVFAALPADQQKEFLTAYFDKEKGIGYNLVRTNIHSCDFSSASYTYVSDEDKALKTFSIDHDQQYRIPFLKKIKAAVGENFTLFASPWSPPAFMKNTHNMLKGGKLMPEYYPAWALYYTKFIKAYEKAGIPIWAITVQNEPMATQTWESCIYTAEEERDFLKNNLGPTMKKEGLSDKKIIIWDHNRDLINQRVNVILSDPDASQYAWGIGYHWYETWTGGEPMFGNVELVHNSYPDKHLIFTEGCNERFDSTKYQSWPNAEHYGRSMINDFNSGTEGWTDWNLLLDQHGGPNHVGNFVFAPIHANTRTGQLIYTPAYYYIGHFSKFIHPNARRVSTAASRSALLSTSFINTDGSMVTVVMNTTNKPVTYKLYVNNVAIEEVIGAHAIQSVVY